MSLTPIEELLADLDEPNSYPRELSWLSFNARVLQEAQDFIGKSANERYIAVDKSFEVLHPRIVLLDESIDDIFLTRVSRAALVDDLLHFGGYSDVSDFDIISEKISNWSKERFLLALLASALSSAKAQVLALRSIE